MNRREILKKTLQIGTLGLVGAGSTLSMPELVYGEALIREPNSEFYSGFLGIFEHKEVEESISVTTESVPKQTMSMYKYKPYDPNENDLLIPLVKYDHEDLKQAAANLILHCGVSRNTLVFDQNNNIKDAIGLMLRVQNENELSQGKRLTDIYIAESATNQYPWLGSPKYNFHTVPTKDMEKLTKIYKDDFHGGFIGDRKNLIIGITRNSNEDCFMSHVQKTETGTITGLVVLNYSNVLLGCY